MKFTIPTSLLKPALATLKPIAKPNATHVILGNIAIVATKDKITLLGMDLDRQLEITLAASVKEQGSTTIPASRICDFVEDSSGDCYIETSEKHETVIRIGNAVCRTLGLSMEDLPPRLETVKGSEINISAKTFNDLLAKSLLHASIDQTRAMLCSVMLTSRNGKLNIQATDGRRGIICITETEMPAGSYMIARESIPAMVKLSEDGELAICFGINTMSVKSEGMEFRTKLLEGNSASLAETLERVYPEKRPLKITASREELESIVKRAQKGISEQAPHITLECDGKTITATGARHAKSSEGEFPEMNQDSAKVAKGSATITVKLNPQFLRDALKCMAQDEVSIEMVDEITPIVIKEGGIRCVICPMKL